MAEVNKLTAPPALYDFVLYWECANKDWINSSKKLSKSSKPRPSLSSMWISFRFPAMVGRISQLW